METATFFTDPESFRSWLDAHHDKINELWVGYYKKATNLSSIKPKSSDFDNQPFIMAQALNIILKPTFLL